MLFLREKHKEEMQILMYVPSGGFSSETLTDD